MGAIDRDDLAQKLIILERFGVALILFAALIPRSRHLEVSFDREVDGARGAALAIGALNYERMGIDAGRGFPLTNLEMPTRLERYEGVGVAPWAGFVDASRSPVPARLVHASLDVLGTPMWTAHWNEVPGRNEFALRLPFLLAHALGLLALWWAARQAFGPQVAMLALGFASAVPVSLFHADLGGPENLALPLLCLCGGFHARFLRDGRVADLVAIPILAFLATWLTLSALFFGAALVLSALAKKDAVRALTVTLAIVLGSGIAAYLFDRARVNALEDLMQPVHPLFASWKSAANELTADRALTTFEHLSESFTLVFLLAALTGLLSRWVRYVRPLVRTTLESLEYPVLGKKTVDLATPWLLAGLATILLDDSERSAHLYLVPAIALGCALFLHQFTRPMLALKAGITPLVVGVSAIGVLGFGRFGLLEQTHRAEPLPRTVAQNLSALELPQDAVVIVPECVEIDRATSFYARKSFLPLDIIDMAAAGTQAVELELLPLRAFVVVPESGELAMKQAVQIMRSTASSRGKPYASNDDWSAWALDG